jgi:predicted RNA-binding protein YlqC (UPF0109 family)
MADDGKQAAELIEFIAKSIVNEADDVNVVIKDDGRLLELETAAGDRGRVIGRQGRVATAMRALLTASGPGADSRLEIVD